MAWFHQPGARVTESMGLRPIHRQTSAPKGLGRSLSLSESGEKNVTTPVVAASPVTKAALEVPALTFWFQWTLPKVGVNLFGKSGEGPLARRELLDVVLTLFWVCITVQKKKSGKHEELLIKD